MSSIYDISGVYPIATPTRASSAPSAGRLAVYGSSAEDTVEFSRAGRALSEAAESSSLRAAKVRAIRAEIEAGTFETPERLHGTVDRLLDVLA